MSVLLEQQAAEIRVDTDGHVLLTEADLEALGPEPTLVPDAVRVGEAPTSQGEVPAAVYLETRSAGVSGVRGARVLAVFLGSMGMTTTAILASYAALLAFGGPRQGQPILVQTPIPYAVQQPAAVVGVNETGLSADPSVEALEVEPVGEPVTSALGVGRDESVVQGGRPEAGEDEAVDDPVAPEVVRVVQVRPVPAPVAPAPRPAPEPVVAPAPAPARAVPHPLSGSYGGRSLGEAVQLDLDFRSDGTVRGAVIREGGARSSARGTFETRRVGGLSFILVEGEGPDRLTYSGGVSGGRATGRVIQGGRSVGRFATAL